MPTARGVLESKVPSEIFRAIKAEPSTVFLVINADTGAEIVFTQYNKRSHSLTRYVKPVATRSPPHKWATTWRGMAI